jgi:RNA polymerase sigma factor (sigma-70 family)
MATLRKMLENARRAVVRRGMLAQDAEDIVQEAFLRVQAYERKHMVRSPEGLLVVAAVNLSLDEVRKRKRAPFDVFDDNALLMADPTPLPDEVLLAQSRLAHLAKGIARLPERTRRILRSRRLEGKSHKDIAIEENMSVAAVEKQVARATLELARWMEEW